MAWRCSVFDCKLKVGDGVSLFRIPKVNERLGKVLKNKQKARRIAWLQRINLRECDLNDNSRVCSRHFASGRPCKSTLDNSHPDWAPTLHITNSMSRNVVDSNMSRYSRRQQREARNKVVKNSESNERNVQVKDEPCVMIYNSHDLVNQVVGMSDNESECLEREEASAVEIDKSKSNSTNNNRSEATGVHRLLEIVTKERDDLLIYQDIMLKLNEQLTARVVSLNQELHDLKEQKKCQLLSDIEKDDKMCLFYTGLNCFKVFQGIFNSLKPALRSDGTFSVRLEEQFLITLMKLRLNLSRKDLAYRFNVTHTTITSYIEKFIEVMFIRLPDVLLRWPDREAVLKTMPLSFRKKYPNVVGILDGTELKSETPGDKLDAVSSPYKSNHTTKFLICSTPQGSISFLSEAFTGRPSDALTVRESGFLEYVKPGMEFLAVSGYINEDDFTELGAKLHRPAYKLERNQLTGVETERSRIIANERIHIERVIGNLKKKFTLLRGTIKIKDFCRDANDNAFIYKIFTVCCCLMNAQPAIVPRY